MGEAMTTEETAEHQDEYDDSRVARLELLWGDGFLSPGGGEEVAKILSGFDLSGKRVLDIGCGLGGVDLLLVREHGAASVLGIDVEGPLLQRASAKAAKAGLDGRIDYQLVRPGPLPLEEAAFDVVFSKDAMIHIPDKPALFAEVLRVLRPGGVFLASDWLQSVEGRGSLEMTKLGEGLGLTFNLATPDEMVVAMEDAGFRNVEIRDRNTWYSALVQEEQSRITGQLRESIVEAMGREDYENWVVGRENVVIATGKGYLRPTHLQGTRG
jgi:SAM-dependent methyltransferase